MKPTAYFRPTSLEEALRLRAGHEGARFLAGGTDLLVRARFGRVPPPEALISLRAVPGLAVLEPGDPFRIGALATMAECLEHEALARLFPAVASAARSMGSVQIRSVATVGGNLCNASPCAELATPLLVHGARAEIRGPGAGREVPLEDFFLGPGRTCLEPGELLTAVLIPAPPPESRSLYRRKGRVRMDLALASVSVRLEMDGGRCRAARVAAGAVAPRPLRLPAVEKLLEGQAVDGALLAEVERAAMGAIRPITDVRAGAGYRRRIVGVYARRAVESLAAGDAS